MHAKNIKTKRVKLYLLIYGVDCPTEAGRFERRIVTQALANFGVLQALELMRVYCFGDAPYDLYLRFERPGTIRPKREEWASNVCSDIALHRTALGRVLIWILGVCLLAAVVLIANKSATAYPVKGKAIRVDLLAA